MNDTLTLKRSEQYKKRLVQEQKAEKMLRNLGFMHCRTFYQAYELFKGFHFGLRGNVKIEEMLDHLDFMCQVERVGPYAPHYPD